MYKENDDEIDYQNNELSDGLSDKFSSNGADSNIDSNIESNIDNQDVLIDNYNTTNTVNNIQKINNALRTVINWDIGTEFFDIVIKKQNDDYKKISYMASIQNYINDINSDKNHELYSLLKSINETWKIFLNKKNKSDKKSDFMNVKMCDVTCVQAIKCHYVYYYIIDLIKDFDDVINDVRNNVVTNEDKYKYDRLKDKFMYFTDMLPDEAKNKLIRAMNNITNNNITNNNVMDVWCYRNDPSLKYLRYIYQRENVLFNDINECCNKLQLFSNNVLCDVETNMFYIKKISDNQIIIGSACYGHGDHISIIRKLGGIHYSRIYSPDHASYHIVYDYSVNNLKDLYDIVKNKQNNYFVNNNYIINNDTFFNTHAYMNTTMYDNGQENRILENIKYTKSMLGMYAQHMNIILSNSEHYKCIYNNMMNSKNILGKLFYLSHDDFIFRNKILKSCKDIFLKLYNGSTYINKNVNKFIDDGYIELILSLRSVIINDKVKEYVELQYDDQDKDKNVYDNLLNDIDVVFLFFHDPCTGYSKQSINVNVNDYNCFHSIIKCLPDNVLEKIRTKLLLQYERVYVNVLKKKLPTDDFYQYDGFIKKIIVESICEFVCESVSMNEQRNIVNEMTKFAEDNRNTHYYNYKYGIYDCLYKIIQSKSNGYGYVKGDVVKSDVVKSDIYDGDCVSHNNMMQNGKMVEYVNSFKMCVDKLLLMNNNKNNDKSAICDILMQYIRIRSCYHLKIVNLSLEKELMVNRIVYHYSVYCDELSGKDNRKNYENVSRFINYLVREVSLYPKKQLINRLDNGNDVFSFYLSQSVKSENTDYYGVQLQFKSVYHNLFISIRCTHIFKIGSQIEMPIKFLCENIYGRKEAYYCNSYYIDSKKNKENEKDGKDSEDGKDGKDGEDVYGKYGKKKSSKKSKDSEDGEDVYDKYGRKESSKKKKDKDSEISGKSNLNDVDPIEAWILKTKKAIYECKNVLFKTLFMKLYEYGLLEVISRYKSYFYISYRAKEQEFVVGKDCGDDDVDDYVLITKDRTVYNSVVLKKQKQYDISNLNLMDMYCLMYIKKYIKKSHDYEDDDEYYFPEKVRFPIIFVYYSYFHENYLENVSDVDYYFKQHTSKSSHICSVSVDKFKFGNIEGFIKSICDDNGIRIYHHYNEEFKYVSYPDATDNLSRYSSHKNKYLS